MPPLPPGEHRVIEYGGVRIEIVNEGDARKVLKLIDALEEHDDVQNVYSNFDIPDSVLQTVEA